MMKRGSGLPPTITSVSSGSIAAELGWLPGDRVLRINETPVVDVLDILFVEGDTEFEILLEHEDGTIGSFIIEKDEEEPLGIDLEPLTVRKCQNNCIFCFIHQQPKNLRKSLSVKDEDYRFSFLHGNYVTLSPVNKSDLDRIISLHLSPMYISVHSTDESLRNMMLGRTKPATPILTILKYLAAGGITMHTQIVLCPEINDGHYLHDTLADLEPLFPSVKSVAVVPVGLTRHRLGLPELRRTTCREATHLVETLSNQQVVYRKKYGLTWLHLADEFYCLSKQNFPESSHYDDFPQLENGVGMIRSFIDEWEGAIAESNGIMTERYRHDSIISGPFGIITGTLFAPWLKKLIKRDFPHRNQEFSVIPVANTLFGASVSVTGLLSGQDIVTRHRYSPFLPKNIIIPNVLFNSDNVTLDDMVLQNIAEQTNRNCITIPSSASNLVQYFI